MSNQKERDFIRMLIENIVVIGSILLVLIGIGMTVLAYTVLPKSPNLGTDLVRGIGIGLIGAAITSGAVSYLITRFPKRFQNQIDKFVQDEVVTKLERFNNNIIEKFGELQEGTSEQTKRLVQISKSLIAMDKLGMSRIYAHRNEASEDMLQDVENSHLSKIRFIGISLNDFIRHENPGLHQVWQIIENYIAHPNNAPPRTTPLDIKVLIIDPNCLGAYLRSVGENRRGQESMLMKDLQITSGLLRQLEAVAKSNSTGVTFTFRYYQLPPQMFLLSTDRASYIEPYYFWASRSASAYMPVSQFTSQNNSQIHLSMEEHFNLIWDWASISSQEFNDQHQVGTDKGMCQSGARNVFSDPALARKRMLWLLQNAKKRVYIQGITLNSFVDDNNPDLFVAIQNLILNGVELKMLLLDPESEQAVYRAFREHHLQTGLPAFEDCEPFLNYLKDQQGFMNEPLYREVFTSIQKLRHKARLAKDRNLFQTKIYQAAPSCFMLLADDTVLVEQYQYGKIKPGVSDVVSPILGKDMPVIEFAKYGSVKQPPIQLESDSEGSPFASLQEREAYSLMESHFEFVFEHCARSIDEIQFADIHLPKALLRANFSLEQSEVEVR